MILTAIKRRVRNWVCPGCDMRDHLPDTKRLERAEKLHAISTLQVSREAEKQVRRVSDMRVAATAAVKRLHHARTEIERSDRGAV